MGRKAIVLQILRKKLERPESGRIYNVGSQESLVRVSEATYASRPIGMPALPLGLLGGRISVLSQVMTSTIPLRNSARGGVNFEGELHRHTSGPPRTGRQG
jgi:hypothetical protein